MRKLQPHSRQHLTVRKIVLRAAATSQTRAKDLLIRARRRRRSHRRSGERSRKSAAKTNARDQALRKIVTDARVQTTRSLNALSPTELAIIAKRLDISRRPARRLSEMLATLNHLLRTTRREEVKVSLRVIRRGAQLKHTTIQSRAPTPQERTLRRRRSLSRRNKGVRILPI